MKLQKRISFFMTVVAVVICLPTFIMPKVNLKSKSSILKVAAGATLTAQNPVTNLTGRVQKEEGATIEGEPLSFNNGIFEEGKNKVNITGTLDVADVIEFVLNGNETLKASKGQIVQKIKIKGSANRLEGEPGVIGDIIFQDDAAEAVYALNGRISSNMVLNGGTIMLEQDLIFADDKLITGSGMVIFNGRKIQLGNTPITWTDSVTFVAGSDIDLNANLFLSNTWTFTGASIINGNNHILTLDAGGEIVVEPNASLLLKNLVIDGISGTNLRCTGTSSSITLQNVDWQLKDNYTYGQGQLSCKHSVRFTGTSIFAYTSDQLCTIDADTKVKLDFGLTFSYDPSTPSQDLLSFVDSTAQLILDGATIYATGAGIRLTKGTLLVKRNSMMGSTVYTVLDEDELELELNGGITLGSGSAADDMTCRLGIGATLEIIEGTLHYKNVLPTSWQMANQLATLRLASNAQLQLHESIDLGPGLLLFEDTTLFGRVPGKTVTGTVEILGDVGYVSVAGP